MHQGHASHPPLLPLTLAALGVVYGDIGTSPLYAFREALHHASVIDAVTILGILSLILWALILTVTVKYLMFVLQADNQGEGGILALSALVSPNADQAVGYRRVLILLGLVGAALVYGDGMITPAISVLSAVEGLDLAFPGFSTYVQPITIAILIGLFAFQPRGTAKVGQIFGPITLVWFLLLAGLGIQAILIHPTVLAAVSPTHAATFLLRDPHVGFAVLGSVFLVMTGGEALYADLGHFGPKPIRIAWFAVVLPALLLNYFGQGAILLERGAEVEHPFFALCPEWALVPMVVMATAATIIASQALISGAFSLTVQAIRLGWLPRLQVAHTSADQAGQIYVPVVNWALLLACIALVLGFQTSSALASAYGIAVTMTMATTTVLFTTVAVERLGWPRPAAYAFGAFFFMIDLVFLSANLIKVADGGWVPLVIGAFLFALFLSWRRGRDELWNALRSRTVPLTDLLETLEHKPPARVEGTAVYLAADRLRAPGAFLANLRHNHVLHERVILLTVEVTDTPYGDDEHRTHLTWIRDGIWQFVVRHGFMQNPNVVALVDELQWEGEPLAVDVTWFLGQEQVHPGEHPITEAWSFVLFRWLNRHKWSAAQYFDLPAERVVELSTRVEV
jgi:KUP system potassium uptake protein